MSRARFQLPIGVMFGSNVEYQLMIRVWWANWSVYWVYDEMEKTRLRTIPQFVLVQINAILVSECNHRSDCNCLDQSSIYSSSYCCCNWIDWLILYDTEILPNISIYRKGCGLCRDHVMLAVHLSIPSKLCTYVTNLEVVVVELNCFSKSSSVLFTAFPIVNITICIYIYICCTL